MFKTSFQVSGTLIYEGQQVGEDDTFLRLKVKMNDKFIVVQSAGGGNKKPLLWRRFKSIQKSQWWCSTSRDCLTWVAQRNVKILGFFWGQEYDKRDFKLKYKFGTGTDESGLTEWLVCENRTNENLIELPGWDKDQFHMFEFKEHGLDCVVEAGQKFSIHAVLAQEEERQFHYCENNTDLRNPEFEGQDPDFTVEYNSNDCNGTSANSGMFPVLMYMPL